MAEIFARRRRRALHQPDRRGTTSSASGWTSRPASCAGSRSSAGGRTPRSASSAQTDGALTGFDLSRRPGLRDREASATARSALGGGVEPERFVLTPPKDAKTHSDPLTPPWGCVLACRALSKGSGSARRLVLSAAAKVNLALEVLGKRADGYHEIATVMQAVDLSDRLILEDADDLELRTTLCGRPDRRSVTSRFERRWRCGGGGGSSAACRSRSTSGSPWRPASAAARRDAAGGPGGAEPAVGAALAARRGWTRWPSRSAWTCRSSCGAAPRWRRAAASRLEPAAGTWRMALVLVNPKFPASTAEMYGRVTPAMYSDGGASAGGRRRAGAGVPARVAASLYNGLEPAATGRVSRRSRRCGPRCWRPARSAR